jgi:hypothetical protein
VEYESTKAASSLCLTYLVAFAILVALQTLLLGTLQKLRGRGYKLLSQRNNVGAETLHDGFGVGVEMSSGHTPETNAG